MRPIKKIIVACMALSGALFVATGCSFDPINYMSRNACEFFNCDELFFIEDMLPLSARPAVAAGAGIVADTGEDEDDGGGHAH